MSDQTNGTTDLDALEQRVAVLEDQVKEIGYVLHDMLEELRGEGGLLSEMAEPPCPPICPRS
jgi:hypothetical protein